MNRLCLNCLSLCWPCTTSSNNSNPLKHTHTIMSGLLLLLSCGQVIPWSLAVASYSGFLGLISHEPWINNQGYSWLVLGSAVPDRVSVRGIPYSYGGVRTGATSRVPMVDQKPWLVDDWLYPAFLSGSSSHLSSHEENACINHCILSFTGHSQPLTIMCHSVSTTKRYQPISAGVT